MALADIGGTLFFVGCASRARGGRRLAQLFA